MNRKKHISPQTSGFRSKTAIKVVPHISSRLAQEKFFEAVNARHVDIIADFVGKGINPNFVNQELGAAPLHILAERNDVEVGQLLLKCKNVDMNLKNHHGYTSLHLCCFCNCYGFMVLLLENNADPNVPDSRFAKMPLHWAIENQHPRLVLCLLENGARTNVLDCFENTPLSLSIVHLQDMILTRILFRFGADLSVENQRSLHIFFETVLHCKSIKDIDFVIFLLRHGVDINMREESTKRNCLHFVALTGYVELAVFLMQKGADFKVLDHMQRTPSKVAQDHGNDVLAEYLRKGYRPPNLLLALPLLFLWSNKMKARIAERRAQKEKAQEEVREMIRQNSKQNSPKASTSKKLLNNSKEARNIKSSANLAPISEEAKTEAPQKPKRPFFKSILKRKGKENQEEPDSKEPKQSDSKRGFFKRFRKKHAEDSSGADVSSGVKASASKSADLKKVSEEGDVGVSTRKDSGEVEGILDEIKVQVNSSRTTRLKFENLPKGSDEEFEF